MCHRTQALPYIELELLLFKSGSRRIHGSAQLSGKQPLNLLAFRVLARLLIIRKLGLLHRLSSLMDNPNQNQKQS